jgi:hypothetical protein
MSHPKHHAWLFSSHAFETALEIIQFRLHSKPRLDGRVPDLWLDKAIEIAMAHRNENNGVFEIEPAELALQVWEIMRPDGCDLA